MSSPIDLSAAELQLRLQRSFPRLKQLGNQGGWIVGGAIRDAFLGLDATDVDLVFEDAASVASGFAKAIGSRPIVLGRTGVEAWRIVSSGVSYDFAELTRGSIEADLSRRDFTINAIALRIDAPQLLDPFGGVQHLGESLVRQIDRQNFADDPLRTLKGVRMAVALGFEIDLGTRDAIEEYAPRLRDVAAERVNAELRLIAAADLFRGIQLMRSMKLTEALELELSEKVLDRLQRLGGSDSTTSLSALFFDSSEEAIVDFVERWKLSAAERQSFLSQRRLGMRMGAGELDDLCAMRIAIYDAGAEEAKRFGKVAVASQLTQANEWRNLVAAELDTILGCDGLLNGDELRLRFGFEGEEIGRWKRRLLERQICGLTTTPETAIEFIESSAR